MNDLIKVEIEVTPEAAAALADDEQRRRVGEMVSRVLRPPTPAEDPLRAILASIKRSGRSAGLTDQDIDEELAKYNAERRT